jgi:4-aminobutyrate aminotransferase
VSKAAADQCLNLVHGQVVIPCSPPPSFTLYSEWRWAQCSIAYHEPYLRLIERLLPIMPHPSLDSFFFASSGSEAVEAALKMARSITRKQNIITMQGAYHGRTFGAMAVTKSKTVYADGFSPLMVRFL